MKMNNRRFIFLILALGAYKCNGQQTPSLPKGFPNLTFDCQVEMLKLSKPIMPLLGSTSSKLTQDDLKNLLASDLGKMIDSWGKLPARLLNLNTQWMGAYDECRTMNNTKFCASNMLIFGRLGGVYGSCMPKGCSDRDVQKLLNFFSQNYLRSAISFPDSGSVTWVTGGSPVLCEDKVKYSTGFYITVVLSAIILAFCLMGSFLDGFIEPTMIEKPTKTKKSRHTSVHQNGSYDNKAVTQDDESNIIPMKSLVINEEEQFPSKEEEMKKEEEVTAESKERKIEMVNGEAMLLQILRCFSLQRNISAVMSTEMPKGAIKPLSGIRAISMWWIILGHILLQGMGAANDNLTVSFIDIITRWSAMPLANPFVSVDTFFFLSGLLVGYLTWKKMQKSNGRINVVLFYIHRFIRLTPAYMYVILFQNNIFQYTLHGPPYWNRRSNDNCQNYWWTNLLYINNFYPKVMSKICVGQSWYIANDMQFYIVSPVILYAMFYLDKRYQNSKHRTLIVSTVIIVLSAICSLINLLITAINDYPVLILKGNSPGNPRQNNIAAHEDIYTKPYTRINPYLIGLFLGYLLIRKIQINPPKFKTLVHLFLWVIAFGLGYAIVYGTYSEAYAKFEYYLSDGSNVMYSTFHRLIWAIAVGWVVYACHHGYGGVINSFLSWGAWVPLSKLTYSAYFVHSMVIDFFYATMDNPYHYQDDLIAFNFMSITFVSYAMAFILAVTVEFPFINLEKILFKMLGVTK